MTLEIRGLVRHFGDLIALDEVDLSAKAGAIHALLGPNGAGKTTLLRIVAGLMDPDRGEVLVQGQDIRMLGYRERRKVFSLVPSGERTSYMRLSGFENLTFFGRLYGLTHREARAQAERCLQMVGLAEASKKRVGLYSQGMQKRLAIARALMVDPPLLLVDEATQSLDPMGARTTRELIRAAAKRGAAVLWTTQRLDEIRGFADTVTVLKQGHVRFRGTVPELSGTVITRTFLIQTAAIGEVAPNQLLEAYGAVEAAGENQHRLRLNDGVSLGTALAALVEGGVEVIACREEVSDVEEAFVRLTSST